MQSAVTVAQARALFGAVPRPLGFVPTMGALHDGHLELVATSSREMRGGRARRSSSTRCSSGRSEDLANYPRDEQGDREKLAAAGVDVLFAPDAATMYPADFSSFVEVGPARRRYSRARSGPVTSAASRRSSPSCSTSSQPDVLFLGQKDAQQAAVLRKMIGELNFPVDVEVVPTVREPDGLAMSSRNRYLDAAERAAAPSLNRALLAARDALERGAAKDEAIAAGIAALSPVAKLDYLDLVDADTFAPLDALRSPAIRSWAPRDSATRA